MHNTLKTKTIATLRDNAIAPEKILGQNFLIDAAVVELIARNAHIQTVASVLEVGTDWVL